MEEIFKDVPGYAGKYKVSNLGNVISLNYNKTKKAQVLRPRLTAQGRYYRVILSGGKCYSIHRLVAMVFLPDYTEDLEVDHIDTNTFNNRADNLRMCTRKENMNNPLTRAKLSKAKKKNF